MAYPATVTNEVDPVSRIEGHLGVAVNVSGGYITDAYAHGNLWRGFENFLLGRDANDAITFVQRICGVCPVPHGMTSTYAVDTVLGYSAGHITFAYDGTNGVPAKAVVIRNLVLGMEFLMSSITHFYHLAAPSYVQGPAIPPWTPYWNDDFYHPYLLSGGRAAPEQGSDTVYSKDLWSTVIRSYVTALRIRRLTFEAGALFAGRMPMTSVYIGGGVTYDGTEDLNVVPSNGSSRLDMFRNLAKEIGNFVIAEYVPVVLALGALYPNFDNKANADVLYGNFPGLWAAAATGNTSAPATGTTGYGAGLGRFLAWGAFPDTQTNATAQLATWGGIKDLNGSTPDFQVKSKADVATYYLAASGTGSVLANLTEDISHSRYSVDSRDVAAYGSATGVSAYPGAVSRTKPFRGQPDGYTYMKAPRWDTYPCEVGPEARMYVQGIFKNGSGLAGSVPGYGAYTKTFEAVTGLDPKMVLPDIAVALVRSGLAALRLEGGTVVGNATGGMPASDPFAAALAPATGVALANAITGAYAASGSVIVGAAAAWVINLSAGLSTMDRLRGRAIESLVMIQNILGALDKDTGGWNAPANKAAKFEVAWGEDGWIYNTALDSTTAGSTWREKAIPTGVKQGWGGTEAPRGALMHQCEITNGKITKYQCIVPTTWNGSPVDADLQHGAIEQACIGAPFSGVMTTFTGQAGAVNNVAGGVEVLRIAQSFDPCIACAIH